LTGCAGVVVDAQRLGHALLTHGSVETKEFFHSCLFDCDAGFHSEFLKNAFYFGERVKMRVRIVSQIKARNAASE
jgi:hypothetical protein